MKRHLIVSLLCALAATITFVPGAMAQPGHHLAVVFDGGNAGVLNLDTKDFEVVEGPAGGKALRFRRSDEGGKHNTSFHAFQATIDLAELGIDPHAYDFIRLDLAADRGAVVVVNLSDYPAKGAACSWYVLDGMRDDHDWRARWVDLDVPEELTTGGERMRAGGDVGTGTPMLRIMGKIQNAAQKETPPGTFIRLGRIRFVKPPVTVHWDQAKAPYDWPDGGDLTFRYPLEVTNQLDRPITANLRLEPFQTRHARTEFERRSVRLAPGETKTVEARISLPADVAESAKPLYCERYDLRVSAEGFEDSDVSLVTSSDPIRLSVTVPIPEEELRFPLLGRRKTLPADLLELPDLDVMKQRLDRVQPGALETAVERGGLEMWNHWRRWLVWLREYNGLEPWKPEGPERRRAAADYEAGTNTSAFLYDLTGEEKYLRKAEKMFMEAADLWPKVQKEYDSQRLKLSSQGLFADNTLHLSFRMGGTTRPPYSYGGTRGNDAWGTKHGVINAFDLVAGDLDPAVRKKILDQWILPMGIHTRNHLIGPGNQQCTHAYVAMYAGLATRNWPLVSFAYSSEHGVLSNIEWAFNDEGIAYEAVARKPGYQEYTITPILGMLELLYHQGINDYDRPKVRAFLKHFKYRDFAEFARDQRIGK